MHAERRPIGVSLLPPTRTTRMNGGPRPVTGIPLPPFRPTDPTDRRLQPNGRRIASAPTPTTPVEVEPGPGTTDIIDDFPLDAFIIPEDSARLPGGMIEGDRRQAQRASDLADRLEALAWRLRREGYSTLSRRTAYGDPVDALLAGILAGYLAAIDD